MGSMNKEPLSQRLLTYGYIVLVWGFLGSFAAVMLYALWIILFSG